MGKVKFTKAQSAILEEVGNTNYIVNYAQRMRAIQPLLDANVIKMTKVFDSELGYAVSIHWDLV